MSEHTMLLIALLSTSISTLCLLKLYSNMSKSIKTMLEVMSHMHGILSAVYMVKKFEESFKDNVVSINNPRKDK